MNYTPFSGNNLLGAEGVYFKKEDSNLYHSVGDEQNLVVWITFDKELEDCRQRAGNKNNLTALSYEHVSGPKPLPEYFIKFLTN